MGVFFKRKCAFFLDRPNGSIYALPSCGADLLKILFRIRFWCIKISIEQFLNQNISLRLLGTNLGFCGFQINDSLNLQLTEEIFVKKDAILVEFLLKLKPDLMELKR